MELLQALQTRRSTKSFLAKPVTQETLTKLIDIARYSPSGANKNPWKFVVTTDKAKLTRLGEAHRACKWLASAPSAIAVVADPAVSKYWLEDSCVAAYSIWLAAMGFGVGAAWAAMYQSDTPEESERRQKYVREIFSIPDNLSVPMVMAVGYPDQPPAERKKMEAKDIISWERYNSTGA
ncbi:MAG: nitroreductase family protein [Chloroflexota bacterium]